MDLSTSVTGIVGFALRIHYNEDRGLGRGFLSFTSIVLWFKLLYYLRPFIDSGPLVVMILRIAYEVRWFIPVLFILLIGFSQAFWIISNVDPDSIFALMSGSLQASFLALLGLQSETNFTGTSAPFAGSVLLNLFLFVMVILMLNLLVALMNDTFSNLSSKKTALWRIEQASIITEQLYLKDFYAPVVRLFWAIEDLFENCLETKSTRKRHRKPPSATVAPKPAQRSITKSSAIPSKDNSQKYYKPFERLQPILTRLWRSLAADAVQDGLDEDGSASRGLSAGNRTLIFHRAKSKTASARMIACDSEATMSANVIANAHVHLS
jgi:hypothetical protein